MTLRLATSDGAQVTPVFRGRRYVSQGGDVIDQACPHVPMTLAAAEAQLAAYRKDADNPACGRLSRPYDEWGDQLSDAICMTRLHRMAAGWMRPEDADQPRRERA